MDTKLTLRLNKEIIEKAKIYAQERKTSLSKIIEIYLNLLTKEEEINEDISPLVQGLSGIIKPEDIDNIKNDYSDYLDQKYK